MLFEFGDTASIGVVVAAGLGLLTAIVAAIAGSTRSRPEPEYGAGYQ